MVAGEDFCGMSAGMVKEDEVFQKVEESLFFADTAEHGLQFHAAGILLFEAFPFVEKFILTAESTDFGVMAILTFFTSVALTIVDSGFSQTLIRKESPTDGEYRSVLGFNVAMSAILYVVLVALAYPLATFYEQPVIATIAPIPPLIIPHISPTTSLQIVLVLLAFFISATHLLAPYILLAALA